MTLIDLTGLKFGRLRVLKMVKRDKWNHLYWLCQCDCGNTKIIMGDSIRSGKTTSCGCFAKEQASKASKKHGLSHSRINRIYHNIKQRCCNSNNKDFYLYGGRGITVCQEWLDDFMNFYNWAMTNGYNDTLTIDRINNYGNYEPSNCRWVTIKQNSNNKRDNHYINYNGEIHTIAEWAEILNLKDSCLRTRLYRNNFQLEKAI